MRRRPRSCPISGPRSIPDPAACAWTAARSNCGTGPATRPRSCSTSRAAAPASAPRRATSPTRRRPSTSHWVTPPAGDGGLFDQTNPENPIADYSMVYVPYCSRRRAHRQQDHGVLTGPDRAPQRVRQRDRRARPPGRGVSRRRGAGRDGCQRGRRTDPAVRRPRRRRAARCPRDDVRRQRRRVSRRAGGERFDRGGHCGGPTRSIRVGRSTPASPPRSGASPGCTSLAGEHNPDITFARFDFAFDEVQSFFGSIAGFEANELVTLIDQTAAQIESSGVPLATYVAPGTSHTIVGQRRVLHDGGGRRPPRRLVHRPVERPV